MPLQESGPTSLNRNKKLHFSFPPAPKEAPVNLPVAKLEIMKLAIRFALLCAAVAFVAAEGTEEQERPKTFRRLIPADVLRDFPGMCFASTKCATIEPTKTWELSPFCGRSTCVPADDNSGRLFELVEDCGPLPKANPKCKLSEKTNKTASFPDCCPIFECEDGVKLEYPDIPTLPPPTGVEAENVQPEAAPKA